MYKRLLIALLVLLVATMQAQNVDKLIRKGNRNYKSGDYTEAEVYYRKVIDASPTNADAHFNLGDALFQQENYDDAMKAYQKVLEVSPDAKLKSKAVFNMGACMMAQEKYYDAFELYKVALKLDENNEDALYNLEYCRTHLVKSRVWVLPNIPHGTVTAREKTAYNGQMVNLSSEPEEDYGLANYIVVKADDTQVTVPVSGSRFEMPKFDVEEYAKRYPHAVPVQVPAKGEIVWQVDVDDDSSAPVAGTEVKAGQGMGFVQTYYGMEEIIPARDGRVVAVLGKQGDNVAKGEIVAFVE